MAQTNFLQKYQWQNRIVLLAAEDEQSMIFQKQRAAILEEKQGFAERDLIVFFVGKEVVRQLIEHKSLAVDPSKLRKAYRLPSTGFEFVLIGKDGGVKLRSQKLVSNEKLFATIDAMPMRRQEMRRQ
ncbi:MAG: DUF4174 domain-containing protein [Bacteroidota bacterium]